MEGKFTATLDFAGPFKFDSKPVEIVVGKSSTNGKSEDEKSNPRSITKAILMIAGIVLVFVAILTRRKKQQDQHKHNR